MTTLLKAAFFGSVALTIASIVGGFFVWLATGYSASYLSMVALSGLFGGLSGHYYDKWQHVSVIERARARDKAAKEDFAFWNAKPVNGFVL